MISEGALWWAKDSLLKKKEKFRKLNSPDSNRRVLLVMRVLKYMKTF